ncbi:hypothetical protein CRENBAI_010418 [Crenichthys baileyi]|uniref:Uncharacterized protein n=1 Tax=Crenichthys baileyi TaxID=28760 RepID=A0AAV9QW68_9TELE
MPEPPQLAPLAVEEQRVYSEPLPDGRAPHPISMAVPGHPTEKAHFSSLYPGSRSFGHDRKFMAILLTNCVTVKSHYPTTAHQSNFWILDFIFQENILQKMREGVLPIR